MLALQVILRTPEPDPATLMAEHSISVLHGESLRIQLWSNIVKWKEEERLKVSRQYRGMMIRAYNADNLRRRNLISRRGLQSLSRDNASKGPNEE